MSKPILKIQPFFDSLIPKRAHPTDSGVDLYAYRFEKLFVIEDNRETEKDISCDNSVTLNPGQRVLVHTGICATVGKGYEIQIRPRSGLALKQGITVLNTPGTIDESYRGFIGVILCNSSAVPHDIKRGDRIAQMVVTPVVLCPIKVVENLEDTDRSSGGFGSTGA